MLLHQHSSAITAARPELFPGSSGVGLTVSAGGVSGPILLSWPRPARFVAHAGADPDPCPQRWATKLLGTSGEGQVAPENGFAKLGMGKAR